jgi:hypothetical protein
MRYTKEQLDGQILVQSGIEYIIEYTGEDTLQFYCESNPSKKYTGYNTYNVNDMLRTKYCGDYLKNRNNNHYEIY